MRSAYVFSARTTTIRQHIGGDVTGADLIGGVYKGIDRKDSNINANGKKMRCSHLLSETRCQKFHS